MLFLLLCIVLYSTKRLYIVVDVITIEYIFSLLLYPSPHITCIFIGCIRCNYNIMYKYLFRIHYIIFLKSLKLKYRPMINHCNESYIKVFNILYYNCTQSSCRLFKPLGYLFIVRYHQ